MDRQKYYNEFKKLQTEQAEMQKSINNNTATEEQKQKYFDNLRRTYELTQILYN